MIVMDSGMGKFKVPKGSDFDDDFWEVPDIRKYILILRKGNSEKINRYL